MTAQSPQSISVDSVDEANRLPGDDSGGGDPIAGGQERGDGDSAGGSVLLRSCAPSISVATAVGMGCAECVRSICASRDCVCLAGERNTIWGQRQGQKLMLPTCFRPNDYSRSRVGTNYNNMIIFCV